MKIKDGFVLRDIAGTTVAVPTENLLDEFKGLIELNESAKFIWECLQNDTSIDEIKQKYIDKYNVKEDKAQEVAEKFVDQLKKANLLQ